MKRFIDCYDDPNTGYAYNLYMDDEGTLYKEDVWKNKGTLVIFADNRIFRESTPDGAPKATPEDHFCPECLKYGIELKMRPSEYVLLCNPPKYPHYCAAGHQTNLSKILI